MIRGAPPHWDLEADLVAVGSGCGGLSAAISAHDHGASALVLERTEQVGGVTAYSTLGRFATCGRYLQRRADVSCSKMVPGACFER